MRDSSAKRSVVPLDTLRGHIAQAVAVAKSYELPDVCVRLGIQSVVKPEDAQEAHASKRLYVRRRILSLDESALLELAEKVLREYPSEDLADSYSEMAVHAEHRVSQLVRRDVLKVLNSLDVLFGELPVTESLQEIFGADVMRDGESWWVDNADLAAQIQQHYLRNDDWSHEELLTQCGALTCSQARFFSLLEKVLHPVTRRDAEQAELAAAIGHALKRDGFTVRQTSVESGYAIYSVVRAQAGVSGALKNLIFASTGEKPELIFRDALNNDVQITKNADKVLIFDRPLPSSGLLLWKDLRDWYAELCDLTDENSAKEQLFRRLRQSVEDTRSPGELAIFQGYYERFGKELGDRLPALVPQVYLHYDPYTRRQRGDEKFLARQRMDFLLMLDHGVRIVIEVDGRHHYATQDPSSLDRYVASAQLYAEMAAEDRRLRLMGYEVYRFGGYEFPDVDLAKRQVGLRAQKCVADFFERLYAKHGVR
ncbi:AbiJ-related protein [Paraburkholderia sp. RL17-373-BIF-A]|uniref:AbiJ-related protein n=1 Tax=Paraburkholderia sp. RL17-373-BIF-A TaxID=3031629 RepID=UPI0038B91B49